MLFFCHINSQDAILEFCWNGTIDSKPLVWVEEKRSDSWPPQSQAINVVMEKNYRELSSFDQVISQILLQEEDKQL